MKEQKEETAIEDLYEAISEERKEMQAKGELPDFFTTGGYQMLKQKYLDEGETPKQRYRAVADTAAEHAYNLYGHMTKGEWSEKFFGLMWDGVLALSTPVLANMGAKNKGCPVSCSGNVIGDSVFDFYSARMELALLTQAGFGTASYMGPIRGRGADISSGGKASGSLPELKGCIQVMRDVSQGNTRRGAWAGYLEVDHPDFYEWVTYLKNYPDDCNIGWLITDDFIDRCEKGDEDAVAKWKKILYVKIITGKGYFIDIDKVNRHVPEMYRERGMTVKSSNLCLTGDTQIRIMKDSDNAPRLVTLSTFVNQMFESGVWKTLSYNIETGENEWKPVTNAALMSTDANVMTVLGRFKKPGEYTYTNYEIRCTPEHRVFVKNKNDYVNAENLIAGTDTLIDREGNELEIISTEFLDRTERVYDITVEDNENFFANDMLVHNCTEIALFSDTEHTFTCVLSSINAVHWNRVKEDDSIFYSTVFLDCVAEDFIRMGEKMPGLEKAVRFTRKGRALGLGVLGLHSHFQNEGMPFESFQAYMLNNQIFKRLHDESLRASQWMAEIAGEPEWCEGHGVRNTHRTAIAPNTSSAVICGGVSQGIEPIPGNCYLQALSAGDVRRINPKLIDIMKERDVYNKKVMNDIRDNKGSVQHVTWLSDEEKELFKTAFEMNMRQILKMASARQKWIDQMQSINLFFDADEEEEYISQIHKEAMLDEGIHSLYYIRTLAGIQASKGDDCEACAG